MAKLWYSSSIYMGLDVQVKYRLGLYLAFNVPTLKSWFLKTNSIWLHLQKTIAVNQQSDQPTISSEAGSWHTKLFLSPQPRSSQWCLCESHKTAQSPVPLGSPGYQSVYSLSALPWCAQTHFPSVTMSVAPSQASPPLWSSTRPLRKMFSRWVFGSARNPFRALQVFWASIQVFGVAM